MSDKPLLKARHHAPFRARRRLGWKLFLLGFLITCLVVCIDYEGLFNHEEDALYDWRVQHCQLFAGPPSDKIVHLDIDDGALQALGDEPQVGAWPWPRNVLARMLDEIVAAKPKVIVLDMLFSEEQHWQISQGDDQSGENEPDAVLGDSIHNAGNVIAATSFTFADRSSQPQLFARMVELIKAKPAIKQPDIVSQLVDDGTPLEVARSLVRRQYPEARDQALDELVARVMEKEDLDPDTLQQRLVPNADDDPGLKAAVANHWAKNRRVQEMEGFSIADPMPGLPIFSVDSQMPPILQVSESANGIGFVEWLPGSDGVARSIPLFVRAGNRIYPSLGFVAALQTLGVPLKNIRISSDSVTIPRPGGSSIVIPVHTMTSKNYRQVALMMDIPWFGNSEWENAYDYPRHLTSARHFSLAGVWDICALQNALNKNQSSLRAAITDLNSSLGHSSASLSSVIDSALPQFSLELLQQLHKEIAERLASSNVDPATRNKIDEASGAIPKLAASCQSTSSMLKTHRNELHSELEGCTAFIGWVATGGAESDFVPTSLHPLCPGVMGHSTVCNAILTGDLWRRLPWIDGVITTILISLATMLLLWTLTPMAALFSVIALAALYVLFNGPVLFGREHLILAMATPLVSMGSIYVTIMTAIVIDEIATRAFITRRFSRYTDPQLMRFLAGNPDQLELPGKKREMTVCFTDIIGFTQMTEQLQERAVELLNDYMEAMVPIIRKHNGCLDKFLGDGIMFFFGAPFDHPQHAIAAVATILDMQQALVDFNARHILLGFPAIGFRAGVSTGMMVVGDTGPDEACAYTVLGDAANLGARLASANRYFNTRCLINQRTADLLGNEFLVRPIGLIRVRGKQQATNVYEPLARLEQATPAQRRIVELSEQLIKNFLQRDFASCLARAAELETAGDNSKMAAVYRDLCSSTVMPTTLEIFVE